jgi:GAF domain-containing protein
MRICEKRNWSSDDWKALSEDAQEDAIAWYEYQTEKQLAYLDLLEEKLHRDKNNKINATEAYYMLLLKRLEYL